MKKDSSKLGQNEAATVIGLDLADRHSTYVALDAAGHIVAEDKVATTCAGLEKHFGGRPRWRIAIEVGTHSPWVSALLTELGHEVIVANPRQVALIYRNQRKSDRLDAINLARLARSDPQLLRPITHRGKEAQTALAVLRSRDVLVANRTQLVNHVRGCVKSAGQRLVSCATEAFHTKAAPGIPEELRPALAAVVDQIASLTASIHRYDQQIDQLIAEHYPQAQVLRQVNGVGPITSLAYLLTIEDPSRFQTSRDVAAYLGLTPGQRQTGASDPELHITKAGDVFLRRLMVQAAHYIIGPFGRDSDLRRWGLRLAGLPAQAAAKQARGGKRRKKRAIVAVARKLAVLLHALWTSGEVYEPLRQAALKEAA